MATMLSTATDFYEHAWSLSNPTDADLAPYLFEKHIQRDMVWQSGRETVGRRSMAKGMRHMRRAVYPDLRFEVERAAAALIPADAGGEDEGSDAPSAGGSGSVFVEWVFRGTFEGREDVARGVTVFDFAAETSDSGESDGGSDERNKLKISRSSVYRQALPAEVDLARRSKKGEVEEGVLLE